MPPYTPVEMPATTTASSAQPHWRGAEPGMPPSAPVEIPATTTTASSAQPRRTGAEASMPPSTPVEMSSLPLQEAQRDSSTADNGISPHQPRPTPPQEDEDTSTAVQSTSTPLTSPPAPTPHLAAAGLTLTITLLLTTGARHPFKLDARYLEKRHVPAVDAGAFSPLAISGYKLKELVWQDWRAEWEPRPVSPSAIRLILLGRMLDDKTPLKDYPFALDSANVVHMTVKPADMAEDDEPAGAKSGFQRAHDAGDHSAGCRCIVL